MTYYTEIQLKKLGLKLVGKNVKISKKASIYNFEKIEKYHLIRIEKLLEKYIELETISYV